MLWRALAPGRGYGEGGTWRTGPSPQPSVYINKKFLVRRPLPANSAALYIYVTAAPVFLLRTTTTAIAPSGAFCAFSGASRIVRAPKVATVASAIPSAKQAGALSLSQ